MSAVLRAAGAGDGRDALPPGVLPGVVPQRAPREAALGVGLWVFIGVATALFALFLTAYVMRMSLPDAVVIAMPPQLALSTALLVLGSAALARAASAEPDAARRWLLAGGACATSFLVAQGWAWGAMLGRQVTPTVHPAASFFYLLTAMHGLHVAGGLAGWGATWRRPAAWRVALCARYWHFVLAVWLALLAAFTWITPDVARVICRTAAPAG
jgi:cytochrome c oxidase subunit 3